jgi:hypothetical protein
MEKEKREGRRELKCNDTRGGEKGNRHRKKEME